MCNLSALAGKVLTAAGVGSGDRVLVALSGGLDSTVLTHALTNWAETNGVGVVACTVDHGLRDFSAERRHVSELCRTLSVELEVVSLAAQLKARARACGMSGEQLARQERYEALELVRRERGCGHIVLAHHLDDQAETVVLRLMRGTGPSGLAAMRPVSDRLLRPFLSVPRSDLLGYSKEHNLAWVDDPTNGSKAHMRNRVRHEVMPLLRTLEPSIDSRLCALAELAAQERDMLEFLADRLLGTRLLSPDGMVVDGFESEVETRLTIRRFLWRVLCCPPPEAGYRRVVSMVCGKADGRVPLIRSLHCLVLGRILRVVNYAEWQTEQHWEPVHVGALESGRQFQFPWGIVKVEPRHNEIRSSVSAGGVLDAIVLGPGDFPLTVRPWTRGDRVETGLHHKLLSDMFRENGIPALLRPYWPVVTGANGEILATGGLRWQRREVGLAPGKGFVLSIKLERDFSECRSAFSDPGGCS